MLVRIFYLLIVSAGCIAGCSRTPSRVAMPGWDPDAFADAVVSKLDKNGDGSLDKTELSAAPGLAWGVKAIDTDKNGALSRDELNQRFELYKKMRIAITNAQLQLAYKGRPLAGANVTLVPEFFLEGVVEPASGETHQEGDVTPIVPDLNPGGLRVGYYRVVVESPTTKVPAKYTKAETTPLGVEVSPVSDDMSSGQIQLVLRD